MNDSRLLLSVQQGDPQAIANFLGNHLASFSLWVTATPNYRYLDLYVESIEPSEPDIILKPIKEIFYQLKPENIELIKISGRRYGEAQSDWQQSFLLSEIVNSAVFQQKSVAVNPPVSNQLKQSFSLQETLFSDLYSLVLAVNHKLQILGVAAKIQRIQHTLSIELRSIEIPEADLCLQIVYEVLSQLDMPKIRDVRVHGFTAKQLTPSWVEEVPIQDILLTSPKVRTAKFVSFREEEEFWRPIGIGLVTGLAIFLLPLSNFAFRGATTLIFDLGTALGSAFMGYVPILLKNPFQDGGVITLAGRSPLLIGFIYGGFGLLFYLTRRVPILMLIVAAIAIVQSILCWTDLATNFIQLSGHLTLWMLFLVFAYCAVGGYSCRNGGERSLYVLFSVFLSLYNLQTYLQLWQTQAGYPNFLAFLGFAITLVIPFLSYKLFDTESLWLPTVKQYLKQVKF